MGRPKKKKEVENGANEGRKLRGIDEISKYIGFSIPTIMTWIQNENFPATKTQGITGVFISSTSQVDKWWDNKIKSRPRRSF